MRTIFAAVLLVGIAAAQTIQLGTSSDPCTGGSGYPSPPLYYGYSIACTVSVTPGLYVVTLGFQDPNNETVGGRLFNASVNGYQGLSKYDITARQIAQNLTPAPAVTVTEDIPAVSVDGTLRVVLTSALPPGAPHSSAVLSTITVTPQAGTSGVPYAGATQDLDLGKFRLLARSIVARSGNGSALFLRHVITAPINTIDADGNFYDAVMYVDPADGALKVLFQSGTIVVLGKP